MVGVYKMKCPKCGYDNKEGVEYCDLCKSVLIEKKQSIIKDEPKEEKRIKSALLEEAEIKGFSIIKP